MAEYTQEDILRLIADLRKDFDSLGTRFTAIEQSIEAQSQQLERLAQQSAQEKASRSPEKSTGWFSTRIQPPPSTSSTTANGGSKPPSPVPSTGATPPGPAGAHGTDESLEPGAMGGKQDPVQSAKSENQSGVNETPWSASNESYQAAQSEAPPPKTESKQTPPPKGERKGKADSSSKSGSKTEQGLESRIGTLWLNRLGVAALLIGFVSLLLYSFQYFGPAVRVVCGAAIAAAAIWFSHRRKAAAEGRKVFFEGLNALGWSLAYFVAYGMYFIEPMKVVPSLAFELPLLLVTAAGGMADAVAFESEATSILSSSFAFLAIDVCVESVNPSFFNLAFLFIAAALTFVSIKQNWRAALFICCILFFGSISYCNFSSQALTTANAFNKLPPPNIILDLSLLAGWLIFNTAIWGLRELPREKRWAVLGTLLVSAFAFPGLLFQSIQLQQPNWDVAAIQGWVYGLVGAAYMFTAGLFKSTKSKDLWSLQYLIGLSLLNTSRWLKMAGFSSSGLIADLSEIVLLTGFGLHFDVPMFRYFAAFWALVALGYWENNLALMLCGVFASGLCCHLYTKPEYQERLSEFEKRLFAPWFYILSNLFALHMIFGCFHSSWQFSALVVQASINTVLSLMLRWQTIIITAGIILFGFVGLGTSLLLDPTQAVVGTLVCYGVYFYCRDLLKKGAGKLEKFWKIAYAIGANLIAFDAISSFAPATWVSGGLGVHGLVMIGLGFWLLERTFRIFALSVFAMVTLRLLFYDLASAPTIARIISFIVAGGVFVGCSYVYTWFSKQILDPGATAPDSESKPESQTTEGEAKEEAAQAGSSENQDGTANGGDNENAGDLSA